MKLIELRDKINDIIEKSPSWANVDRIGIVTESYEDGSKDMLWLEDFRSICCDGQGMVATFLMVKHKLETWIVWFIVDILYVAQYWMLPNQVLYLMGLNIIWTVMAVISFINWKAILNKA